MADRPAGHTGRTAHRVVSWIGVAAAAVAVVGTVERPSLILLWAFLLAFGLAGLPSDLRAARRRRRDRAARPG